MNDYLLAEFNLEEQDRTRGENLEDYKTKLSTAIDALRNKNKSTSIPFIHSESYFDSLSLNIWKDYKKPEDSKAFDLGRFTNQIINKTFDNINVTNQIDTGFATQLKILHGGYNGYNIISNFINLDDYMNDRRGEFKYLYSYDNDLTESKRLYDVLFKDYAGFYKGSFKQSDIITVSVFNYFHKFNLSCASIYNRVLFPNIIYNAAVLRYYISNLSKGIKNNKNNNDSLDDIFKFISSMNGKGYGSDALDLITSCKYNIVYGKRNPNETYASFNDYSINVATYPQLHIVDMNYTPSLINKFYIKLLDTLMPMNNDKNIVEFSNKYSLISGLYNSPFMIEFNHINLLNTTIYSILRILKATSYYDPETDTDYAYSNGLILEPFVE